MQKLIFGCGYLGRRVALRWIDQGHTVWSLTRTEARALELAQLGIRPIVGDICDPDSLRNLPSVQTALFAVAFDRTSNRTRSEVAIGGLSHVLAAIRSKVDRMIYISSTSVYGQDEGEWVDELSECNPVQPGGALCLAAEQLLSSDAAESGFQRLILRLSGIYGPDRLLSRLASLKAGEVLAGRPDAWLNLIHVEDAVQAVISSESIEDPCRTYLVTDDQPIHRDHYFGKLAELVGAPSPRFDPSINPARGSGGINKRCSNRRMRKELRFDLHYPTIIAGLPQALGQLAMPTRVPAWPVE